MMFVAADRVPTTLHATKRGTPSMFLESSLRFLSAVGIGSLGWQTSAACCPSRAPIAEPGWIWFCFGT